MSFIIGRQVKGLNGLVDAPDERADRDNSPSIVRIVLCSVILVLFFLSIGGCVSSSSPSSPAPSSTVVVPSGTTVICSDGTSPPCR
jgi:hypothetical protein